MSDFQAIADGVEIEALRGESTDAVMMRDYDRLALLFTHDGALRMPNIPAELAGREEIRGWGERVPILVDFLVQTTHPGTIRFDGDTASGRAYMQELGRGRDGRTGLNFAIYHDRYQRTGDGWKFTERVYEVRYLDTTPLAGSAPSTGDAEDPRPTSPLLRGRYRSAAVTATAAAITSAHPEKNRTAPTASTAGRAARRAPPASVRAAESVQAR